MDPKMPRTRWKLSKHSRPDLNLQKLISKNASAPNALKRRVSNVVQSKPVQCSLRNMESQRKTSSRLKLLHNHREANWRQSQSKYQIKSNSKRQERVKLKVIQNIKLDYMQIIKLMKAFPDQSQKCLNQLQMLWFFQIMFRARSRNRNHLIKLWLTLSQSNWPNRT